MSEGIKFGISSIALAVAILIVMKLIPWAMNDWFPDTRPAEASEVADGYARKVCVDDYVFILNTYKGGIVQMFVYEEEGITPARCTKNK